MKIKNKLYLNAGILTFLILVLFFSVYINTQKLSQTNKNYKLAQEIHKNVAELDIITYEYLLHHEKRMEQQWRLKYEATLLTLKKIAQSEKTDKLIKHIESQKLKMKCIINTHCHIDHVAEAKSIQDYFNIPFLIHKNELPALEILESNNGLFEIAVTGTPTTKDFLQHNDKKESKKY